jgi:hypothetical protein
LIHAGWSEERYVFYAVLSHFIIKACLQQIRYSAQFLKNAVGSTEGRSFEFCKAVLMRVNR